MGSELSSDQLDGLIFLTAGSGNIILTQVVDRLAIAQRIRAREHEPVFSNLGCLKTAQCAASHGTRNAAIPLADGSFLQPLYFQRCQQDTDTRVVVCKMLSGEERYTSTYTPLDG